ncbi:MAG: hypothetical protein IK104_01270 [Clostridia bacterium]|nr:hypothetical protein [Clostridia bacterium]
MKAVMISIRPEWCEKLANRTKTLEVRKTKPKLKPPFKCYIYCTKPKKILHAVYTKQDYRGYFSDEDYDQIPENYKTFVKVPDRNSPFCCIPYSGKVIGEFVCDWIIPMSVTYSDENSHCALREFPFTGMTDKDILGFLGNGKAGYGWHITDLVIYEKPKKLSDFQKACDHMEDCGSCRRFDRSEYDCIAGLTRPPQSWCYVEELV